MNSSSALDELALLDGIVSTYQSLDGDQQPTSQDTKRALLRANGWQIDSDAMIADAVGELQARYHDRILPLEIIRNSGKPVRLKIRKPVHWRLEMEGGWLKTVEGKSNSELRIPALPSGVHTLVLEQQGKQERTRLIIAPETAPSVKEITGREKVWGVNMALYGLYQEGVPGIGSYQHLSEAATALSSHGVDFVGINPVHSMGWENTEVISPYSPSHRGYLNTSHIDVRGINPSSDGTRKLLSQWNSTVEKPSSNFVDYKTHSKFHRPILRSLYNDFIASANAHQKVELEQFRAKEGYGLLQFARYECLVETYGSDSRNWPADLAKDVDASDRLYENELFHIWMQWHADMQVTAAQATACASGMGLGLYLDLAIGPRREGAESFAYDAEIAHGVSIGAPPDHLSPAGQNWNLAAYSPRKLAENDYRAFREILRSNMRRCGVLRIDHVLGLYRSFWIPDDGTPGGYIKQNFDAMLAIVRIEAERNQTVVIGEDLGLVPDGLRAALKKSGIYSYAVLQYEKNRSGKFREPSKLRPQSLACFGTHDTPTLKGFAKSEDIRWWRKLGWIDQKDEVELHKKRALEVRDLTQLGNSGSRETEDEFNRLNDSVHSALAGSPVKMVSVQFDDIEAKQDAQNLPGTIDEHPNWRRRATMPVEAINTHSGLKNIGNIMKDNDRGASETG